MAKSPKRHQAEQNTEQTSGSESSYAASATGAYDRDRVASRAYELYMQRGGGDGNDMEDWFTAEREFSGNGQSQASRYGDSQAAENLRDSND
jgi:hypothetical protein